MSSAIDYAPMYPMSQQALPYAQPPEDWQLPTETLGRQTPLSQPLFQGQQSHLQAYDPFQGYDWGPQDPNTALDLLALAALDPELPPVPKEHAVSAETDSRIAQLEARIKRLEGTMKEQLIEFLEGVELYVDKLMEWAKLSKRVVDNFIADIKVAKESLGGNEGRGDGAV
ncbi:uncharacterized protein LY89DRAFT_742902 [Mollisia scopiformis]|uniref:Uncharacterized protein n=1 Tax=Mollisia scopiformis TaxID=149040 RepID=A0A132B4T0_MOLSC|nr:uncharacterized protein LY89DRAFT_742902 [Mollisia scopiformis]KUJ07253.1 hypothetical protein LY89DRAFT_742902 [Mollisia scopiformis]